MAWVWKELKIVFSIINKCSYLYLNTAETNITIFLFIKIRENFHV